MDKTVGDVQVIGLVYSRFVSQSASAVGLLTATGIIKREATPCNDTMR